MFHFLFGRRENGPTGYSHSVLILSGPQGDSWNIRRKATLLLKARKAQKMLSLCQKLYLKQDRNPNCPGKGYQVSGGISKGGRKAFHNKGCHDAFYLQYWRYWTQHLNVNCCYTLTAVQITDWVGTSRKIWDTIDSETFAKGFTCCHQNM